MSDAATDDGETVDLTDADDGDPDDGDPDAGPADDGDDTEFGEGAAADAGTGDEVDADDEAELVADGEEEEGDEMTVEALIDDLDGVAGERDELRAALEQATAERDDSLADSQRIAAELANFRKQVDKRNVELLARAGGDLVERLLPVLDACDGAIQHGSTDVEPIRTALFDILGREGLEVVSPESGEAFDPNRHEAVSHVTDGGDDGGDGPVVDAVMRAGYVWNGRVLRAAMVTVRG